MLMVGAFLALSGSGCRMFGRGEDAAPAGQEPGRIALRLDKSKPYGTGETPAEAARTAAEEEGVLYRLRPSDGIIITLSTPATQEAQMVVDENGMIKLPLLDPIKAAGLSSSELEKSIQKAYLDNHIYKYVTVNVQVPSRSYFVQGEVRSPGRYPLIGGVTLLQAIAAAGGYTDFANPKKVEIKRGDELLKLNAKTIQRNPDKDIFVKTGDVIVVRRSYW